MISTVIIVQITLTHPIMNTATNISQYVSNANHTNYFSSCLSVYQQTLVGSSEGSDEGTTCTFAHVAISTDPYDKSLIVKLLFRQIRTFPNNPSVLLSNVIATVASYFSIKTEFL